ncbi:MULTISPECIES: hypothetical protein [Vagococcus]|uniref:CN hydrolase domain-containing protein n=1 Tax=Vagococcus fluvialis bH819 TaxID=1255619 RepID=A0A1X6WNF0_9ENTE|nr:MULTISPECIES: hypothetical protein [Vagococcus]SLM85799.1 hypothetical protein FM121_06840 [Vagococcus fluvialis bH819]HCM90221.1 hypothetical protein [Vagococcus sp.]
MKSLLCQAKHENNLETLEKLLIDYPDIDYMLFPEGYLNNIDSLNKAKMLAKKYHTYIISSLRHHGDTAIVIDAFGDILYNRKKTASHDEEKLVNPVFFTDSHHQKNVGFLLCMEILKGMRDLPLIHYDFILQPIGVGMFKEEQFDLWLNEAIKIAKKFNTIVIGASHSDGSYKNCGVSIPISYCIDSNGVPVYVLKNQLKTQIIEITDNNSVRLINSF